MKKFADITLNIKIIAYLLLFVVLTSIGYFIASGAIKEQAIINKAILENNHKISQFGKLKDNNINLFSEVKQHIIFDDPESLLLSENKIALLYQEIDLLLSNTRETASNDEMLLLNEYFFQYETFRKSLQEIITLSDVNDSLAIHLLDNSAFVQFVKIESVFKEIDANLENKTQYLSQQVKDSERNIFIQSIVLLLVGIFITAGGGVFFIYDLVLPLKKFRARLNKIANGEIPDDEISDKSDLVGSMVFDLNLIRSNLQLLTDFAHELRNGNYHAKYELKGESDEIGKILVSLRDSLMKSKQEQQQQFIENEQRNWIERGISNFNEILRLYSNDIKELGHQIISATVQYLGAIQGGIFILHDEKTDDIHLELAASYAYNRRKFLQKRIDIGDGLIGLSVLEKETIHLTELPEDYLEITSGLGDAKPVSILIVPLMKEDVVHGVIEISSFIPFEPHQIQFVQRLGTTIASTLSSVKINERTNRLLAESQKQSEELASQEEEMRQNLEELRAIQEEAEKQILEYKSALDNIDPFIFRVELDKEGQIIRSNNTFLNFVTLPEDKLIGKPIIDFMPASAVENVKEYIKSAIDGYSATYEIVVEFRSEVYKLYNRISPVYNVYHQVSKLILLGFATSILPHGTENVDKETNEDASVLNTNAWQTASSVWSMQMQEYQDLVVKLSEKEQEVSQLNQLLSADNNTANAQINENDPDLKNWKEGLSTEND